MSSCLSTFEQGTHSCQLTDPRHYDLHKDGPTRWSDVQADENQKKAA